MQELHTRQPCTSQGLTMFATPELRLAQVGDSFLSLRWNLYLLSHHLSCIPRSLLYTLFDIRSLGVLVPSVRCCEPYVLFTSATVFGHVVAIVYSSPCTCNAIRPQSRFRVDLLLIEHRELLRLPVGTPHGLEEATNL